MINSIDINLIRSMCDKANLATTVDNDGDLYLLLNADQDYGHNVIVFFSVTDNKWLRTFAMTDMEIPQNRLGDAMVRVNRYNEKNYLMKAYITENGLSCNDRVHLDGQVHDPDRIDFLHRYLLELKKGMDEGAPVKGYLQWSFLDNFEWSLGYTERFGVVYVDYPTGRRIPKDSARWYAQVMNTNGECL